MGWTCSDRKLEYEESEAWIARAVMLKLEQGDSEKGKMAVTTNFLGSLIAAGQKLESKHRSAMLQI